MDKREFVEAPLVSIIIPVYNAEKTISRCIESLLNQTYSNIEIICVNDCSKDQSEAIIKDYQNKDSRIRLITHEKNMNAGGARNSGLRQSKGDYICLVDNDDWLANNAIEVLVNASENGNSDLVMCQCYTYYSEENKSIRPTIPDHLSLKEKKVYGLMKGSRMLGALIKKTLFTDNELRYPERIFYEDNPVHTTLLLCAKNIKTIERPLYYYYQSSTSVTGFTNIKKITDRINTTDLLLTNVQTRGLYNEFKEYVDSAYIDLLCGTIFMLGKADSKDSFRLVREVKSRIKGRLSYKSWKYLDALFKMVSLCPITFYLMAKSKKKIKMVFNK